MAMRHFFGMGILVALGCAAPQPAQPPLDLAPITLSGAEWRVVNQVVLITDSSWSMSESGSFPQAKALTQSFVRALPEAGTRSKTPGDYEVGALGFGGDARLTSPLAPLDREVLTATTDRLHILGAPHPRTPLHDVLDEVSGALAGKSGGAAVVLFSDGIPDSPEAAMKAAGRLIASVPAGVCIHTVHTGTDAEGKAFLERLATRTPCGSARAAADVGTASAYSDFVRTVIVAAVPSLPAVGAIDPCKRPVSLRAVEFEFDKADVTAEGEETLVVVLERLAECGDTKLNIDGHTDSVGTPLYNQGLSEDRAAAVARYLTERGIAIERLTTRGYGEQRPTASNDTDAGRAQNRRVEIAPE